MKMTATWVVAGIAAAALLAAGPAAGQTKVINPAGSEASDIVKQVMQTYGIEQGEVAFVDSGTWTFGSERSAVVAMETRLRADAVLEYGETAAYGKQLQDKELHYIHVFYLADLAPDKTYHVRLTCTDRNGRKAVSRDVAVETKTVADAVHIPDDLPGPPYELNKPNTTYIVTKDIVAPKTAFRIPAAGVTLDLGGHTVTYNEEHMGLPTDSFNVMVKDSAFGVRAVAPKDLKILNGTIRQGKGNDEGSYTTIGFNPIYLTGGANSEIAGVTCVYAGTQITGIIGHYPGAGIRIHHCVVDDGGNRISDRHQQCGAIKLASPGGGKLYNNLVKRARQGALPSAGTNVEVAHNELHIDSHSINSFGIGVKDGSDVHDNRIFGRGDNVIGIGTTGGCDKVKLHDNYIWLQAHDISAYKQDLNTKEMESSEYSIMSGVRITWGSKSVDYYKNVILVTAREGGKVRGTFFSADEASRGALFRDNLVIALCEDDKSDGWGAVAGVGTASRGPVVPIEFVNNTLVSNFANFNMQDDYGTSNNYRFVGNTFVKVGDRPDYATIRARRSSGYPSTGHVLLDSVFEGGAGYDRNTARDANQINAAWLLTLSGQAGAEVSIKNEDGKTVYTGKLTKEGSVSVPLNDELQVMTKMDDFTVQWTLTISAPAGADVSIKDKDGNDAFTGKIGDDGKLAVPLTEFKQNGRTKTVMTPHSVTVTKDGKTATKSVEMNAKKDVPIAL